MHIKLKDSFQKLTKEAKETGSSPASCENSDAGHAAPGGVLLLNSAHHINLYCVRAL